MCASISYFLDDLHMYGGLIMKKYAIVPKSSEDILSIRLLEGKLITGVLLLPDNDTLSLVERIFGDNNIPFISSSNFSILPISPYFLRMEEKGTVIVYKRESFLTVERL